MKRKVYETIVRKRSVEQLKERIRAQGKILDTCNLEDLAALLDIYIQQEVRFLAATPGEDMERGIALVKGLLIVQHRFLSLAESLEEDQARLNKIKGEEHESSI